MYCVLCNSCRDAYVCCAVLEFPSHSSMLLERYVIRLVLYNEHILFGYPSEGTVLLTQHCSDDTIENDMGVACTAYGGQERRIQDFGGET